MTNNNDNNFAEIMTNHVVYKVSYSLMKCIDCTLFLVLRALQDHQLSDFPNNTPLQSFWRGSSRNWFHSLKITQQKKYLMKKSWQTKTMTTGMLKMNSDQTLKAFIFGWKVLLLCSSCARQTLSVWVTKFPNWNEEYFWPQCFNHESAI